MAQLIYIPVLKNSVVNSRYCILEKPAPGRSLQRTADGLRLLLRDQVARLCHRFQKGNDPLPDRFFRYLVMSCGLCDHLVQSHSLLEQLPQVGSLGIDPADGLTMLPGASDSDQGIFTADFFQDDS